MEADVLGKRNGNAYPIPCSSMILGVGIPETQEDDGLNKDQFICSSVDIVKTLFSFSTNYKPCPIGC